MDAKAASSRALGEVAAPVDRESEFNPNSEVGFGLAVGGTGYQPVPRGTEGIPGKFTDVHFHRGRPPIPPGPWPGGTGRLPVPPISASEFGFNDHSVTISFPKGRR